MSELFTEKEVQAYMRNEVYAAGGAKKWLKKNNMTFNHAIHMIENGDAATLDRVLDVLGFRRVTRYEPITNAATDAANT